MLEFSHTSLNSFIRPCDFLHGSFLRFSTIRCLSTHSIWTSAKSSASWKNLAPGLFSISSLYQTSRAHLMAQLLGLTKDESFQPICSNRTCSKISWTMPLFTREASWIEASPWGLRLHCLSHRVDGWDGAENPRATQATISIDAPPFVGRVVTRAAAFTVKEVVKSTDQIYMRQLKTSNSLNLSDEGTNVLLDQ